MPSPSTIQIIYDAEGTNLDITNKVQYKPTSFDSSSNAIPGTFEMVINDKDRSLSFSTGKTIKAVLDGQTLWKGYIRTTRRRFAFPVVDTRDIDKVTTRQWVVAGVDENVLFDARVLRNTADYLHQLPNFTKDKYDGELIREQLCPNFLDLPAGFDFLTQVEDVTPPFDPLNEGLSGEGAWLQQGSTWRQQMNDFQQFSGAVYYILDGALHYHALESSESDWGFSDVPDGLNSIGFREAEVTRDGSVVVDDALIWGGSEWQGDGQTVFAREKNETAIADQGRWQIGEVHFGEDGYKLQSGVDARADVIVNGAPGAVGGDPTRGLWAPQWSVRLSWFAHHVPVIGGVRTHLRPGDLVTFTFNALGDDGDPLVLVLPLRSLHISFPALADSGDTYVRFDGTFALQQSDPKVLWTYLLKAQAQRQRNAVIATATSASTDAVYGTYYSGEPLPTPTDGTTTVFTLDPSTFSYIAGTTQVYMDGKLQRPGIEYTESDPNSGEITFATAPTAGAELWIICRLS